MRSGVAANKTPKRGRGEVVSNPTDCATAMGRTRESDTCLRAASDRRLREAYRPRNIKPTAVFHAPKQQRYWRSCHCDDDEGGAVKNTVYESRCDQRICLVVHPPEYHTHQRVVKKHMSDSNERR